jgi:hypothetical protein
MGFQKRDILVRWGLFCSREVRELGRRSQTINEEPNGGHDEQHEQDLVSPASPGVPRHRAFEPAPGGAVQMAAAIRARPGHAGVAGAAPAAVRVKTSSALGANSRFRLIHLPAFRALDAGDPGSGSLDGHGSASILAAVIQSTRRLLALELR